MIKDPHSSTTKNPVAPLSQPEESESTSQDAGTDTGHVRSCSYCKQEKPWINSGKKLKDGSKIYVDDAGARWSGRRCPSCERNRVYAAVRCDSFERDAIIRQLETQGYTLKSRTLPLKVEKDGKTYTVGIRRAFTDGNKIVLESAADPGSDLMALVFESLRLCSLEQMERLAPNIDFYAPSNQ
jgi:hypothetical protein